MPIIFREHQNCVLGFFSAPNAQFIEPCSISVRERYVVISLKKYLDMEPAKPSTADPIPGTAPQPGDLLAAALESYRAALLSMGTNSVRACAAVGVDLQKRLADLERGVSGKATPALLRETEQKVEEQLEEWGECSAEYLKTKANDVKELLLAVVHTAQSIDDRDRKYADQLAQFSAHLQGIASLDDLTEIRESLMAGAAELKTYVEGMTKDNNSLAKQLKTEVAVYESKLKAAEESVIRDGLTGLSNRRNVEERIEIRIAKGQPFCVAILDLDSFKEVNATYGQLAGDSLLKQFAVELRNNSRPHDTVGRWGGDEFIIVLDCDLAGANLQLDRTKKWMFGEYKIQSAGGAAEIKVRATASIGLAQWQPGESLSDVIEQADNSMSTEKGLKHGQKR
jgi:diguanylate cyclase